MIAVQLTNFESTSVQPVHHSCWCGQEANYTLELTNARVGTGRFHRCRQHARRDMETKDFKVVEAWI
jgi:hypothetical protein